MATQLKTDISQAGLAILSYRSNYYVGFKNLTIQRWAAKFTKRDEYYTLNRTFWIKATDSGVPDDTIKVAGAGHTMYYPTSERAEEIAQEFLDGLIEKGIL